MADQNYRPWGVRQTPGPSSPPEPSNRTAGWNPPPPTTTMSPAATPQPTPRFSGQNRRSLTAPTLPPSTSAVTATPSVAPQPNIVSYTLPANIVSYRIKIAGVGQSVGQLGKVMDGLVFGYVGVDAVIGLVPVASGILTGVTTFWLVSKAGEVKMAMGDRVLMSGIGMIDGIFGFAPPGVGVVPDFFFRAHAWNSARIQRHVENQLAQIDAIELDLQRPMPEEHHAKSLQQLEDSLFRGGRTKQEGWIRMGIIAVACLSLLGYCTYQEQQRQAQVAACKAKESIPWSWFC